ncbi:MAG: tetratricopeptide repeat protein [Thiobacillaceae bacterium]
MSLLLKALKQAEQGAGKPNGGDPNLDLEPMDTPFSVRREWVQPNDNETPAAVAAGRPGARWELPRLDLVPAAALIALLVAIGYGIYVYLAIGQPGTLATLARHPQAPRPAQPAQPSPATEPARIAPVQVPRAPVSVAPTTNLAGAPRSPAPLAHVIAATHGHPRSLVRRPPAVAPARQVLPTLQGTIPPAELEAAYQAYRTGDLDKARQLYSRVVSRDKNPDALLGLAAIAMLQGRPAEGVRLYQQVLDVDPRNATAQAALLDTLGTTDNAAAESQLKTQIQQGPSAYLYYALGNLYADQKRWSDAEAAYFDAFKREPANGDYAFNLAVSLDHLQQPDAALRNYEFALKLATPESRFKRSLAEARIQQLTSH